jgi:hypothetical protein
MFEKELVIASPRSLVRESSRIGVSPAVVAKPPDALQVIESCFSEG